MSTPAPRRGTKWDQYKFLACSVWNRLGPDKALAALSVLASSQVTDEGLVVLEIAPREEGAA